MRVMEMECVMEIYMVIGCASTCQVLCTKTEATAM